MAKKTVNIALIGTKFMGKAHSNGFRQVDKFFDLPVKPVMKVICGKNPEETEAAAEQFGWEEASTDWKKVVARDDIDVVDISTPGYLHHPMAIAAAKAGKHIICEKPLANTAKEAKEMVAAVEKAGVKNMCGFSYRFVPAVAEIKRMIKKGELGKIYHYRAAYQQDFIMDPNFPRIWRLQKKLTGAGALGDIGAHIIDMCHNLVGPIGEVCSATETFIKERPLEDGKGKKGKVDVDDAAIFLGRIKNSNTLCTFEATRFAGGQRNHHTFEIYGSKGSVIWDLEHMNYFKYYNMSDPDLAQGFRLVHATDPGHPYAEAWWPPAHLIGYEHTFTHEIYEFLRTLNKKKVDYPTFQDGLNCQLVLDAVEKAAENKRWVRVG